MAGRILSAVVTLLSLQFMAGRILSEVVTLLPLQFMAGRILRTVVTLLPLQGMAGRIGSVKRGCYATRTALPDSSGFSALGQRPIPL
jgi:hypothetical protein